MSVKSEMCGKGVTVEWPMGRLHHASLFSCANWSLDCALCHILLSTQMPSYPSAELNDFSNDYCKFLLIAGLLKMLMDVSAI